MNLFLSYILNYFHHFQPFLYYKKCARLKEVIRPNFDQCVLLLQMWNGNANLITIWYSYCLKGTWYLQTAVVHSKNLSWPELRRQTSTSWLKWKPLQWTLFTESRIQKVYSWLLRFKEDLQFGDLKINLCEKKINNHATNQPFCWLNSGDGKWNKITFAAILLGQSCYGDV